MSLGMILLVVLALLILFGVLQRVLDRMALTDKQALLCVVAIFIGGWLPDLNLGAVTLNWGGAVIPLAVCIYLFFHAGTGMERGRCLLASVLTAAAVYAIGVFFPANPVTMPFDPMILYGLCGGIIAWLLGRSRRSAFVAGSAGALDAVVLSGITAVLLCELVGEVMERIARGRRQTAAEGGQSA